MNTSEYSTSERKGAKRITRHSLYQKLKTRYLNEAKLHSADSRTLLKAHGELAKVETQLASALSELKATKERLAETTAELSKLQDEDHPTEEDS